MTPMATQSGKTGNHPARLEKAREEGQFAAAREFVSALQFMIFLGVLSAGGAHWFGQFRSTARELFAMAFAPDCGGGFDAHRLEDRVAALPAAGAGGAAVVAATVMFRLLPRAFG